MQDIESASRARQRNWRDGEGADQYAATRRDDNLAELHEDKREMRREVYREAPELEGRPFAKHHPGRSR